MTTRGKPENVESYSISLPLDAHKAMWKKVSARDTMPSRYPHELPLATLGIIEDFWAVCDVSEGNGFGHMFRGRWPSYWRLTLEFLSTLKVNKDRRTRVPESIDFRLGNHNHTFTMEDLCEVFQCYNPNLDEEVEYAYSDMWRAMKFEGEDFMPAYAKSSSIRNLILRYPHRAMTQLMFARTDGWSVSQAEMDVIWSLLNKKGINFGILFTIYVDRISKKDGSTIWCGRLITAIAEMFAFRWRTSLRTWVICLSPMRSSLRWASRRQIRAAKSFSYRRSGITFPFLSRN